MLFSNDYSAVVWFICFSPFCIRKKSSKCRCFSKLGSGLEDLWRPPLRKPDFIQDPSFLEDFAVLMLGILVWCVTTDPEVTFWHRSTFEDRKFKFFFFFIWDRHQSFFRLLVSAHFSIQKYELWKPVFTENNRNPLVKTKKCKYLSDIFCEH